MGKKLKCEQVQIDFIDDISCIWIRTDYKGCPSMKLSFLAEMTEAQKNIRNVLDNPTEINKFKYHVWSSKTSGVFSHGIDLAYFLEALRLKDKSKFVNYTKACINSLYPIATGFEDRVITISLVQGDALGLGFETALASDLIVAEESARFGFPEMMFNMLPGMVSMSFLTQKVALPVIKGIIANNKMYTAKELEKMGIVDLVVPDGQGDSAVIHLIRQYSTREAGHFGLKKAFRRKYPMDYNELIDIADIWVESAMRMDNKNIKMLEFILQEQRKIWEKDIMDV